jgi:hypothetical protein
VGPLERVHDGDVDLGAVERAVFRVELPRHAELVQALLQLLREKKRGNKLGCEKQNKT